MRNVALDACYPFARYTLSDPDVPLTVHLEAFNPLIPHDIERSGLPVAILRYVLVNPTDEPVRASVAASLYNFIGYDSSRRRGQWSSKPAEPGQLLGGNVNELRPAASDGLPLSGLFMRSERVIARTPQDGTMALVALSREATWRRSWGPNHWNRHILSFWDDFSDDGCLDDMPDAPPSPQGQGQIGSLAVGATVPPCGSAAPHLSPSAGTFPTAPRPDAAGTRSTRKAAGSATTTRRNTQTPGTWPCMSRHN